MALPLPRVIPDVGPGGPLVTAMGGMNSLANDILLRKINAVKEKYAPLTTQAEAASKLAYANLMAPQFIAKAMNNPAFMANLTEEQKNALRDMVNSAGTNAPNINAINQIPQNTGIGEPSTNSFSGRVKNAFHALTGQAQQQAPMQMQNRNTMAQPMPQQQTNQQQAGNPSTFADENGNNQIALQAYDKWMKSPEGQAELAKGENANIPNEQQVVQWATQKNQQASPSTEMGGIGGQQRPTWSENTGTQKGIENELAESGKIRAKNIDELNNTVFNSETNAVTLDSINKILASPEFEQIRQVPLLGHHELSYYAKEGTPEQQQMVGQYYTLTGNLIKDASRDFAGQFRKGEQTLLQGMKPSPNDTVDTAKGKSETLTVLNKMLAERSRITSKIMSEYHVNKLAAQEAADKQINGDQIRKQIHEQLNPMVEIVNSKTGERKQVTAAEARKLGVPNV